MPIYDNENPHPEYGKNPNIRNEQGHTEYPKLVFPKDFKLAGKTPTKAELEARVVVNNPTEEAEVTESGTIQPKEAVQSKPTKPASWGKPN